MSVVPYLLGGEYRGLHIYQTHATPTDSPAGPTRFRATPYTCFTRVEPGRITPVEMRFGAATRRLGVRGPAAEPLMSQTPGRHSQTHATPTDSPAGPTLFRATPCTVLHTFGKKS